MQPWAKYNLELSNFRNLAAKVSATGNVNIIIQDFHERLKSHSHRRRTETARASLEAALARFANEPTGPQPPWQIVLDDDRTKHRQYARVIDQDTKRTLDFVLVQSDKIAPILSMYDGDAVRTFHR